MENPSSFAIKILSFITSMSGFHAYFIIFIVLFICGLGVPIPEDITLISAGLLAGNGGISFVGAIIVCFLGVLIGDTLLFSIGQKYGRKVFKWPFFKRIFTPNRILKAEKSVKDHAKKICFTARFMPGFRAIIFLTAGVMKIPFRTFIFQDGLAALVSVPVWVYLGYWFSENIEGALRFAKDLNKILILVMITALLVFIYHQWRKKHD